MFEKKKETAPALPIPAFNATGKAPVRPGPILEAIEHFSGNCEGAPVYNASGCLFDNGVVLLRTYAANPFKLYLQMGRAWFEVMTIPAGDPAIAELQAAGALTMHGPSPSQRARRQEKEAEEARKLEEYRAYQRCRGEIKRAALDAAAAAESKRRAALFN